MEELRQIDIELVKLNARRRELEQKRQQTVDETIEKLLADLESLGISRGYVSSYISRSGAGNDGQDGGQGEG
ncbi:MAG: hypothetical protein AAF268_17020 [Cyanobacteria bacterium P01_A01_bin.3]